MSVSHRGKPYRAPTSLSAQTGPWISGLPPQRSFTEPVVRALRSISIGAFFCTAQTRIIPQQT